jgi:hypothetical protein
MESIKVSLIEEEMFLKPQVGELQRSMLEGQYLMTLLLGIIGLVQGTCKNLLGG